MIKIDAHQHFWQYTPAEYGWISAEMEILQKDHLPSNLSLLTQAIGIDGTIAVQARQTLAETKWLLALADQHPFISGVVGWVDLRSPNVQAQLEQFAGHSKFCGVRHVLQDEPDDQFMLRDNFVRGLKLLAQFNLTYDILIVPRQLPAACKLVKKLPHQPFVLDHIAKPLIKDGILLPWAEDIRKLAMYPNVCCKVSGMVTEADWQAWQSNDFSPYLDVVFDAFGPNRIMFGSDWPVCTVAGSYPDVVNIVADYTRQLSKIEQTQVWGETARKFYGIK
jgi:L-fuconolactonase